MTDALDDIFAEGPFARGEQPGGPNYATAQRRKRLAEKRTASTPHKRLLKAAARAIKRRWPEAKIEVRQVGHFVAGSGRHTRRVMVGQPGESDLRVTLRGRAIAVEIKAGRDQQRAAQARWQRRFEAAGGVYGIARSVNDALAIVERGDRGAP